MSQSSWYGSRYKTIAENADITTVIYDAEATDPDGDTLTYSISGTDASYVEIDEDDGEVRLLNPIMKLRIVIHLMLQHLMESYLIPKLLQ